jgi:hypothetical protein
MNQKHPTPDQNERVLYLVLGLLALGVVFLCALAEML